MVCEQTKPIVTCSQPLTCFPALDAANMYYYFAVSSDWFVALFVSVMIGQSGYRFISCT